MSDYISIRIKDSLTHTFPAQLEENIAQNYAFFLNIYSAMPEENTQSWNLLGTARVKCKFLRDMLCLPEVFGDSLLYSVSNHLSVDERGIQKET